MFSCHHNTTTTQHKHTPSPASVSQLFKSQEYTRVAGKFSARFLKKRRSIVTVEARDHWGSDTGTSPDLINNSVPIVCRRTLFTISNIHTQNHAIFFKVRVDSISVESGKGNMRDNVRLILFKCTFSYRHSW